MKIKNKLVIAQRIILISFKNFIVYRFSFWFQIIFSFFPILSSYFLWSIIYKNKSQINGFQFSDTITYVIAANIIYNFLKSDCFSIPAQIRQGDLNNYLVKPVSFIFYRYFSLIGNKFVFIVLNLIPIIILLIVLNILGIIYLPISLTNILYCILFSCIGISLNFLIDCTIGLVAFWLDQISFIYIVKEILMWLLAGMLIPLDFLPAKFQNLINYLPFKFLGYYPTVLLIGKQNFEFHELLNCALWLFILVLLMLYLWKKGLKEYNGYGW